MDLKRCALALAGLAVALLGVEAGARWRAAPRQGHTRATAVRHLFARHPSLVHAPRPGAEQAVWDLEFATSVRFNRFGMRGPEPTPLPAHGRRVVWLGDSFALGLQVPEAATAAARLEAQLSMPQRPVQVWNAGVDDYGTWQATERLTTLLDRGVRVDAAVLVMYLGNDLLDNLRPRHGGRKPQAVTPPPLESPPVWLTGAWLARGWERWEQARDPRHQQRLRDELVVTVDDDALASQLGPTEAALQALVERCEAEDVDLVVVLAPRQTSVDVALGEAAVEGAGLDVAAFDPDRVARAVAAVVPGPATVVDLTGPLREAHADGAALFLPWDGHWTERGHTVVADVVAGPLAGRLEPVLAGP